MGLGTWRGLFSAVAAIGLGSLVSVPSARAVQVDAANAPDDNLALTLAAIQGAQSSILLNIYELDAPQITDALIERIQAGLTVKILEEGQPVGGLSTAAKGAQYQIQQAMQAARNGDDALFEMTSKAGGKRRYRYDHAKYAVIDGENLLIGSENYSPTGNPAPGTVGNRGWEVVIHDGGIAQQFTDIFGQDAVTTYADVLALVGGRNYSYAMTSLFGGDEVPATGAFLDDFTTRRPRPTTHRPTKPKPRPVASHPTTTTHKPRPSTTVQPTPEPYPSDVTSAQPMQGQVDNSFDASDAEPIHSPDTSLNGLVSAIQGAQTSIDIEQMTFNSAWNSSTPRSPVLEAVIAAAQRGVHVRVLLNDESVFNQSDDEEKSSKPINAPTAQTLNDLASQGLQIEARIANIKAMGVDYIHNKGMLIDGNQTLISSINWDENSIMNNREAAVLITSPDVFNYYEGLFSADWDHSASGASVRDRLSVRLAAPIAVSEMSDDAAHTAPFECPRSISARVEFGTLSVGGTDYGSLSGHTLSGDFEQVSSGDRCLLSKSDGSPTYVELRAVSSGGVSLLLEGYTPKSEKIYSVRAKLSHSTGSASGIDASVYEGSGTHQRIGDATLSVSMK